jgi:hypothetical protein
LWHSPIAKIGFELLAHALPLATKGKTMKKAKNDSDMLDEYDFSQGERGKYAKRYAEGSNVVVLAPELAQVFPNSKAVNAALRALVNAARKTVKKSAS